MFLLLGAFWLLATPGADYAVDNENWNGLSRFWQLAGNLRANIRKTEDLDWAQLDPKRDALMFWSSETWVPSAKLWAFLHQGGRAAIAEDFRGGASIFGELGLALVPEEEAFPVAVPMTDAHPLTKGLRRLVGNHAVSFVPVPTPLWAFPGSTRALVLEIPVGAGKLLLVSDPSLLINDMLGRGDNRLFARRLLQWLSDGHRRIHLLVRYTERNWPLPPAPPATEPLWRQILAWLNDWRARLGGGLGWRMAAILLLGPFFYLLLSLATRSVFPAPSAPPRLSTRSELSRLWLRLFALSEMLSRRMGLDAAWYSVPSRRLREQARKRLGDSPRLEAFVQLAAELSQSMNARSAAGLDHALLAQWVETIEDFLNDFSESPDDFSHALPGDPD